MAFQFQFGSTPPQLPQTSFAIDLELSGGYRGFQPPVNRLPFELLARIFELGLIQPDELRQPQPKSAALKYALGLAYVCSRWRAIVVTTPVLWSCIDVSPTSVGLERTIARLKTQLERASSVIVGLDITLNLVSLRRAAQIRSLWDIFVPHLPRCERLDIGGIRASAVNVVFPLPKLERLEELSLQTESALWSSSVFVTEVEVAPRLTSLRLANIALGTIPFSHSLHSLYLSTQISEVLQTVDDVVDMLHKWPRAVDLRVLELKGFDYSGDYEAGPVELPHLVTLRISDNESLRPYFRMPNLKALKCDSLGQCERSQDLPSVEHLTTIGGSCDWPWTLANFTSVKTLVMTGNIDISSWYHALGTRERFRSPDEPSSSFSNVPVYLPSLELLQVNYPGRTFMVKAAIDSFEPLVTIMRLRPHLNVELVGSMGHFRVWAKGMPEIVARVVELEA